MVASHTYPGQGPTHQTGVEPTTFWSQEGAAASRAAAGQGPNMVSLTNYPRYLGAKVLYHKMILKQFFPSYFFLQIRTVSKPQKEHSVEASRTLSIPSTHFVWTR